MPTHRKRLRRFEIAGHARFLTFSCFQALPLFNNDRIKDAFAEHLEQVRQRGGCAVHAWVIMPEHVHLVITPALPEWTIVRSLLALKRPFAQKVIARWRELRAPILNRICDSRGTFRFWQRGGGYDRNIVTPEELIEKIEYVHANPVRRQLVSLAGEWRWSSAAWYEGNRDGPVTIDPPDL
jgi:putative transposase